MFLSVADNRSMSGPATPSCLCTVVRPAVEWDLELEFGSTGGIPCRFLRPSFRSRRRSLGRCARSCEKACLLDHFFSGAVVAVPAPPGAVAGFSFRSHAATARMTMHTPMSIPLISRVMFPSTTPESPARPMPSSRPRQQRAVAADLIRHPVRAQRVPLEGRSVRQPARIALHCIVDAMSSCASDASGGHSSRHFQPPLECSLFGHQVDTKSWRPLGSILDGGS